MLSRSPRWMVSTRRKPGRPPGRGALAGGNGAGSRLGNVVPTALIVRRVAQVVQVSVGYAGQAFKPVVPENPVSTLTELARGGSGQGAMQGIGFGQQIYILGQVVPGKALVGLPRRSRMQPVWWNCVIRRVIWTRERLGPHSGIAGVGSTVSRSSSSDDPKTDLFRLTCLWKGGNPSGSCSVGKGWHYVAGLLLGYDMNFSMVRAEFINESLATDTDKNIVVISGLAASAFQILLGIFLYKTYGHVIALIVLSAALIGRIMTIVSTQIIGRLQDEDKLSIMLGLPPEIIPFASIPLYC